MFGFYMLNHSAARLVPFAHSVTATGAWKADQDFFKVFAKIASPNDRERSFHDSKTVFRPLSF